MSKYPDGHQLAEFQQCSTIAPIIGASPTRKASMKLGYVVRDRWRILRIAACCVPGGSQVARVSIKICTSFQEILKPGCTVGWGVETCPIFEMIGKKAL